MTLSCERICFPQQCKQRLCLCRENIFKGCVIDVGICNFQPYALPTSIFLRNMEAKLNYETSLHVCSFVVCCGNSVTPNIQYVAKFS